MSQTMQAALAMIIATMFAMSQHRNIVVLKDRMLRTEIGTQTTGVAVDRLEEIGTLAFDQNTVGENKVLLPIGLTSGPPFEQDQPGNDIDDLDGTAVDTFRVYGGQVLNFRLETSVSYASEVDPDQEVTGPTRIKKATVRAYSLDLSHPDTITLSQSYLCGSRCAW